MKISDEAVTRARAVFAAWGPVPPDDVIRKALKAALYQPVASGQRRSRGRQPRAGQNPERGLRAAARATERNKRLIEAGETFAGHKRSDFRR